MMPSNMKPLLQGYDIHAWTRMVRRVTDQPWLEVAAVRSEAVAPNRVRYLITLHDHTDAITAIGKEATPVEGAFFDAVAPQLAFIAPTPWYVEEVSRADADPTSWVLMNDVPSDMLPDNWSADDVEHILADLTGLHATYWGHVPSEFDWLPQFLDMFGRSETSSTTSQPIDTSAEHAFNTVGQLAPLFRQAGDGLRTLLALGPWPGVIESHHLRAAADLLDDPLPMMSRLRGQPQTLLHGYPGIYNWRVSIFGERKLVDWRTVSVGPAVCDLACYLETFDLLQRKDGGWKMRPRRPLSEETMIDTYIFRLAALLGRDIPTRQIRHAIPAARCLYILLHWLPRFHSWFRWLTHHENFWQMLDGLSSAELEASGLQSVLDLKPYLAATFKRFIDAYYRL